MNFSFLLNSHRLIKSIHLEQYINPSQKGYLPISVNGSIIYQVAHIRNLTFLLISFPLFLVHSMIKLSIPKYCLNLIHFSQHSSHSSFLPSMPLIVFSCYKAS